MQVALHSAIQLHSFIFPLAFSASPLCSFRLLFLDLALHFQT